MPAYYEMSETRMVSHEHKYLAVWHGDWEELAII